MASSLAKLVGNLKKDQCKNMSQCFKEEKNLDLLLRKGVYPYDYMNCLEKLEETRLPPKEEFYSKLNKRDISDEDYEHVQKVWTEFKMKTMRDYHNLYLKIDTLLLADVFENFRNVCMKIYKLDPAFYYTSPGLSWDAMLKITKIELELISDPDMLLFFEKSIRGGIAMAVKRYGEANNKYMKNYDSSKKSKYITYLDANNLYGHAMSKKLPTKGFRWMEEEELDNWKDFPCFLEVDLDYPKNIHNLHNDYPLAPERKIINKVEKLIPTLGTNIKYVLHHQNLKLYERLGMKILNIHRGIKFEESNWMKQYIDLNTDLRTKATNDFEKDFFQIDE